MALKRESPAHLNLVLGVSVVHDCVCADLITETVVFLRQLLRAVSLLVKSLFIYS